MPNEDFEISREIKPVLYRPGAANALIHAAPDYARFLTDLAEIFSGIPYEKRKECMDALREDISDFFQNRPHYVHLSHPQLMYLFDKTRKCILTGKSYLAYSCLDKWEYCDGTYSYFDELRTRLRAVTNDCASVRSLIRRKSPEDSKQANPDNIAQPQRTTL